MSEPRIVPYGLIVTIQDCPKYRKALNGRRAKVINGDYGDVRLEVEGMRNEQAISGHFYVTRSCLSVDMADGTTMSLSKWLREAANNIPKTAQYACPYNKQTERKLIMIGNYRVALAFYVDDTSEAVKLALQHSRPADNDGAERVTHGHKSYEFACFDNDLSIGDTVLVKSGHHGFAVAIIVNFREKLPNDDKGLEREIICQVDLMPHKVRIDNRRHAAELKEQMEQRAAELQDLVLYESLAKNDPKMLELLNQFKSLT